MATRLDWCAHKLVRVMSVSPGIILSSCRQKHSARSCVQHVYTTFTFTLVIWVLCITTCSLIPCVFVLRSDSDAETTTVLKQTIVASDEDDAVAESKAKKTKKPKKKKQQDSDSEAAAADSDVEEITKKVKSLKVKKKPAKKAGFDLLMADMSDDEQPEPPAAPEPVSDDELEAKPAKKASDKKGKKAKRGKKDDEDMDKVLAEFSAALEVEYAGGKKAEVAAEVSETKGKAKKTVVVELDDNDDGGEDGDENGGGTVKTAAQKKKEKKERQKREAAELKIKQKAGGDELEQPLEEAVSPALKKEKAKKIKELPVETIAEPDDATNVEIAEASEEVEKKKNKKKTKAEREEEKEREKEAAAAAKKKKGGMSAALVAAMQERLAKVKEEEEKAKVCHFDTN